MQGRLLEWRMPDNLSLVSKRSGPLARQAYSVRTSRLILREFRAEDAGPLFELNSDPEVLRYTRESPFADERDAAHFIRNYSQYEEHGFGRWAVEHVETGKFLGFCGLRKASPNADVDLAFRLFQRHWARGYATEAARAALTAGFRDFGLDEIVSRAMRENLPSISVLQKLGMRFREVAEENDLFWLVYSISARTHRKQQQP